MNLPLVFHDSVDKDIAEACDWYENRRPGISHLLLQEIEACLSRISARPLGFPVFKGLVRRIALRQFPHHLYFVVKSDQIKVLGLVHVRRGPTSLQGRT